jgi:hypothetical protein
MSGKPPKGAAMVVTVISSRDFSRNVARAMRAADEGPVYITNRGVPRYVFQRIGGSGRGHGKPDMSLLALMDSLPDAGDASFDDLSANLELKTPDFPTGD